MNLTVGAGKIDRDLANANELLVRYRTDDGLRYLDHQPTTDADALVPEDLAVTILINSRVGPAAFKSVQDRGGLLPLKSLPHKSLEATDEDERDQLASMIAEMASWPGFAASVATKILHKKRPQLIPILDNQAIFGAYMNPAWPSQRSSQDSIYAKTRIREALDWITFDIVRPENARVWPELHAMEPTRSMIEIFDMVWWVHFRTLEPVTPASPV